MEDREQYSTSLPGTQDALARLEAELQAWRDIGIDVLEAAALSDEDGMRGCMGAIAERLRGTRQIVVTRAVPAAPQPVTVTLHTETGTVTPTLVQAAEEVAKAVAAAVEVEKPKKRHNWSPESREAARQRVMVTNAKRKAAKAATNGHASTPEPVSEPAEAPAIYNPTGARMEACAQEIRGLIAADTFAASEVPGLAARHNISVHAVETLWGEEVRRARRSEKTVVTG